MTGADIAHRLAPWFDAEIAALYEHAPVRGDGVLMGCPIWGRAYIERFARWCLPSLLAPANRAALAGRCRMVLYIEPEARPMVFRLTGPLRRAGIDLQLREIPGWVMELTPDPELRFCVLGCVQNVLVHMAGRAGVGFHMLMCDHLYGPTYFERMFALGAEHDAIAQAGVSVALETAAKDIDQHRTPDGALVVPDRALGDIAVHHLHAEAMANTMAAGSVPNRLPAYHRLIWRGVDALHIYSFFGNPAWLSPALCRAAPVAFTSSMDCLLPELVPGEFYVPRPADGMAFVALSTAGNPVRNGYVGADQFAEWVWNRLSFQRHCFPYFERPTLLATSPWREGMDAEDIAGDQRRVLALLEERRDAEIERYLLRKFGSRFERAAMQSRTQPPQLRAAA